MISLAKIPFAACHMNVRCQDKRFEFSSGGRYTSVAADFTVLTMLNELGFGDLKRRPQEIHFSGCINESYAFHGTGGDFFVKMNRQFSAAEMFEGEAESLRQLASTHTIRVPAPLAVGDLPDGCGSYIIMEYLQFLPFGMMQSSSQRALGAQLARLHRAGVEGGANGGFGFPLTTRLGVLPLDNSMSDSWADFFIHRRLKDRLKRVAEKFGEEALELSAMADNLLERASDLLQGLKVQPCLLHGDLWVGNTGLTRGGEVAMFDPACYVGHSEFDLAFQAWRPTKDFPGFSRDFYSAYHEVLPQSPGFEDRHLLYQLFHLLNHLLIYGNEYYFHVRRVAEDICKGKAATTVGPS